MESIMARYRHSELVARCDRHADRADDAGLYTTANTLWLAARELERLRAEVHHGIETFLTDPPASEFQRGYLAGLLNMWAVGKWPQDETTDAARLLLNRKQEV